MSGHGGLDWDDLEQWTFHHAYTIPASELSGNTTQGYGDEASFANRTILDLDDILDRDELGALAMAMAGISVQSPGTQTADGSVRGAVAVGPDVARQEVVSPSPGSGAATFATTGGTVDNISFLEIGDDTLDAIGRPLVAMGGSNFSDGASGVGGGASDGHDSWEVVYGLNGPTYGPRDEIHTAGVIDAQNIDDSFIEVDVFGQLVFRAFDHR